MFFVDSPLPVSVAIFCFFNTYGFLFIFAGQHGWSFLLAREWLCFFFRANYGRAIGGRGGEVMKKMVCFRVRRVQVGIVAHF